MVASNSEKKWVVRSGGPEDGADVCSKVRVIPPKVIFTSESGRRVSGRGVGAILPERTEVSPGTSQGSWVPQVEGWSDTGLRAGRSPSPQGL